MNIIKLQDMLRSVPDNALINYVQNPQGEVPSYLALSELQRRKDTRAKYQQQQTPESSVAEDLEQETAQGGLAMLAKNPIAQGAPTSQGVADLPVDDSMYQEQNFASGGIVAFDNGGRVYPNYEGPATSAIGRAFGSITGGLKGYVDKKSKLMDLQQQIETLQPNLFESLTPSELSTRKAKIQELKAQQDAIRNPSSGYVYAPNEKAVDPTMKSYIDQEAMRKQEGKGKGLNLLSEEEKAQMLKDQAAKNKTKDTKPATETQTTQTEQKPGESYEDSLRRRMAIYKEFMGDDSDKTKLKEKIDAMEKRAARQEEMAPWMALTEAGFKTMAGTSPFALANIGAGAEAGIKSYGAAQDKLASLEEKRYALMNEAAKADRAERQAAITFGENSYQHQAAMDQKDRIANMNAQIEREKIAASKQIAKDKLSSDANILRMANFGLKDQAAIEKYVKDKMGTDALILENLRKLDPSKLDEKKKTLLKTFMEKEARLQKEAMQKYDVNSLVNKAKPGLAGINLLDPSQYTMEVLKD